MVMCSSCEKLINAFQEIPPHKALKLIAAEQNKMGEMGFEIIEHYVCSACGEKWIRDRDRKDEHGMHAVWELKMDI